MKRAQKQQLAEIPDLTRWADHHILPYLLMEAAMSINAGRKCADVMKAWGLKKDRSMSVQILKLGAEMRCKVGGERPSMMIDGWAEGFDDVGRQRRSSRCRSSRAAATHGSQGWLLPLRHTQWRRAREVCRGVFVCSLSPGNRGRTVVAPWS